MEDEFASFGLIQGEDILEGSASEDDFVSPDDLLSSGASVVRNPDVDRIRDHYRLSEINYGFALASEEPSIRNELLGALRVIHRLSTDARTRLAGYIKSVGTEVPNLDRVSELFDTPLGTLLAAGQSGYSGAVQQVSPYTFIKSLSSRGIHYGCGLTPEKEVEVFFPGNDHRVVFSADSWKACPSFPDVNAFLCGFGISLLPTPSTSKEKVAHDLTRVLLSYLTVSISQTGLERSLSVRLPSGTSVVVGHHGNTAAYSSLRGARLIASFIPVLSGRRVSSDAGDLFVACFSAVMSYLSGGVKALPYIPSELSSLLAAWKTDIKAYRAFYESLLKRFVCPLPGVKPALVSDMEDIDSIEKFNRTLVWHGNHSGVSPASFAKNLDLFRSMRGSEDSVANVLYKSAGEGPIGLSRGDHLAGWAALIGPVLEKMRLDPVRLDRPIIEVAVASDSILMFKAFFLKESGVNVTYYPSKDSVELSSFTVDRVSHNAGDLVIFDLGGGPNAALYNSRLAELFRGLHHEMKARRGKEDSRPICLLARAYAHTFDFEKSLDYSSITRIGFSPVGFRSHNGQLGFGVCFGDISAPSHYSPVGTVRTVLSAFISGYLLYALISNWSRLLHMFGEAVSCYPQIHQRSYAIDLSYANIGELSAGNQALILSRLKPQLAVSQLTGAEF